MALSVKDFHRDKLWRRMSHAMGQKAVNIPVFLVNEDQLDTLFPPQYRRAFDPDFLRRYFRERRDDFDIDRIDWYDWEAYRRIVAVALYVSKTSLPAEAEVLEKGDEEEITDEARDAYLNQPGPRIYICGERVVNWADRTGCPHHIALDKVYYHELGHAVMDTYEGPSSNNPYLTNWGRTIEECAANHIAYSCFSGVEARFVQKLISRQPAEYLGYLGLRRPQPFPLPMAEPASWDSDDQRHFRDLLRRLFEGEFYLRDWRLMNPPHRWHPRWLHAWEEMLWRIRHEDWDDILRFMRRHGLPPSLPFLGWGPWGGGVAGNGRDAAIASHNIALWRRYKAQGAPRYPEYVILLKEWATYLLRVGVMD